MIDSYISWFTIYINNALSVNQMDYVWTKMGAWPILEEHRYILISNYLKNVEPRKNLK